MQVIGFSAYQQGMEVEPQSTKCKIAIGSCIGFAATATMGIFWTIGMANTIQFNNAYNDLCN